MGQKMVVFDQKNQIFSNIFCKNMVLPIDIFCYMIYNIYTRVVESGSKWFEVVKNRSNSKSEARELQA